MAWPLWRTGDSSKVKHIITVKPAILFLIVYSKEFKTHSNKNFYTNVHSNTFPNRQKEEITQYPPTDEWINKCVYIHTTEYDSAIKNE